MIEEQEMVKIEKRDLAGNGRSTPIVRLPAGADLFHDPRRLLRDELFLRQRPAIQESQVHDPARRDGAQHQPDLLAMPFSTKMRYTISSGSPSRTW